MKLWRVTDPKLKGCAFCGLYDRLWEAKYHAASWHRPEHDPLGRYPIQKYLPMKGTR